MPSLRTVLMLEIIYGIPPRLLFKELFEELQEIIWDRIKADHTLLGLYGDLAAEDRELREFCAYAEMLRIPHASEADYSKVRKHITELAKKLAYV